MNVNDITVFLTVTTDNSSKLNVDATSLPKAAMPSRETYAFKYEDLDRLFAFADANGLEDELFHIVVTRWNQARMH